MSKIFEALEAANQFRQEEPKPKYFDRSNKTIEGLSRAIPGLKEGMSGLSDELVVIKQPQSVIAESFRFLRSQILLPSKGNPPPRTIMVTSPLAGDGKTFVASNLAAIISQSLDAGVLLIDADLRKPHAHHIFGVRSSENGLASHLSSNTPLASIIRKTDVATLSLIPGGNCTTNPAELLSSEKMRALIHEVKDRYSDRFIVIDTSPLELTPESLIIAHEVDAVLMVVCHGKTPRGAVQNALKKIPNEKLLGIVFNSSQEMESYYKKHGYSYSQR
jgi:protein-tyrosine kinase